ncbi:hypothetical protein EJ04DRAFT_295309 [Polyplosphaeria fusca]|uniref:Uncharacterized protein n=1 Tax=Polyplosphaeria fusca TaxID=682080 RepID=A0A9P4QXV4_9PLEO|nr:hypothetical protein EJ04DRAFT_295309 [Polyplosphaeria fusca]
MQQRKRKQPSRVSLTAGVSPSRATGVLLFGCDPREEPWYSRFKSLQRTNFLPAPGIGHPCYHGSSGTAPDRNCSTLQMRVHAMQTAVPPRPAGQLSATGSREDSPLAASALGLYSPRPALAMQVYVVECPSRITLHAAERILHSTCFDWPREPVRVPEAVAAQKAVQAHPKRLGKNDRKR